MSVQSRTGHATGAAAPTLASVTLASVRPASVRPASVGPAGLSRATLTLATVFLATSMLGGCALAMLNGAASSGGASSGGAPPAQTASHKAADDAISTSVRSKFAASPVLKALNLSVATQDGVVTLRGQVASVEQRNAAQLDARAVKGVRSVQNLITVR